MASLKLIGHRGERGRYPENTLPALLASATAGAFGVEFDLQFAADGVPILMHDADVARTTGRRGLVQEMDSSSLRHLPAGEPRRFGERFADVHVPALTDAVEALRSTPGVTLFPEIKTDSLPRHNRPGAIRRIMDACREVLDRTVLISFDEEILRFARSQGAPRIGWVLSDIDPVSLERAGVLQPDFLFIGRAGMLPGRLRDGPWRWVVYEINAAAEAQRLADQGIWAVETACVEDLAAALADGGRG